MRLFDRRASLTAVLLLLLFFGNAAAVENGLRDALYDTGQLKPVDSTLKVAPGQAAPDFTLPRLDASSSNGSESVTLSDHFGKRPVALIFGSYT